MKKNYKYRMIILLLFTTCISRAQDQNYIVTPYLDIRHSEGVNIVYCATFGLAWKQLQNQILHDKVKVHGENLLVKKMNESDPVRIDTESSLNIAGFVRDSVDLKIISAMKNRFGIDVDLSRFTDDPENIICYSFFRKNIKFNTEFEKFENPFPFFSGSDSYDTFYFGILNTGSSELHRNLRKLVRVVDYNSKRDFILSLSNPEDPDEIILAAVEPEELLGHTIKNVMNRLETSASTELADNDRLLIPELKINLERSFDELKGLKLRNEGFEDYFFAESVLGINFVMNESGVTADSDAKLILSKGPGPRTLMLNFPYLLMIKSKNSYKPYFAVWIENPRAFLLSEDSI